MEINFLNFFCIFTRKLHIVFSLIIEKDIDNKWSIFPLPAFQEATLMFNIGTTKKDLGTIQDSLTILTEVSMKIS